MELTGEHRIPAPRQTVWEALQDPDILKDCITGCQRLEKVSDHEMSATVQAKVGPVKARFEATVEIVDPHPPERYTLTGEGKGGVAGFAKGSADVVLAEDGEETILTYTANARVGGRLAQLGSRLVDTTARKYAADFFECFCAKLGAPVAAQAGEEGAEEIDLATAQPAVVPPHVEDDIETRLEVEAGKRTWGGPWFWGILVFAAVVLVLIALR